MDNTYRESALDKWLHKNKMKTKDLADMVGCTRPVIWKVKVGRPIWDKYASRIERLTGGEVCPVSKPFGRPRSR